MAETEQERITLRVILDERDIRRVFFRRFGRNLLIDGALIFVSIFVFFLTASRFITSDLPGFLRYIALAALGLGVMLPTLVKLARIFRIARANATSHAVTTYEFGNDGIKASGDGWSMHAEWSNVNVVVESSRDFYFTAGHQAVQIPKRFFESSQQLDDFKRLLKGRVKLGFDAR